MVYLLNLSNGEIYVSTYNSAFYTFCALYINFCSVCFYTFPNLTQKYCEVGNISLPILQGTEIQRG